MLPQTRTADRGGSPPRVLDAAGRPWRGNGNGQDRRAARRWIKTGFGGYIQQLYGLERDPVIRAREPFYTHAWVYAAAMATARNVAQAPLGVWVETEDETQQRMARAKRMGVAWQGARAGRKRTAIERHLRRKGRKWGLASKSLEPAPEHSLSILLAKPNPYMTGQQLIEATVLWLQIAGESPWLLTKEDGTSIAPGEEPGAIWPLIPSQVKPWIEDHVHVGWRISRGMFPRIPGTGTERRVRLHELIVFKYTNPRDLLRGLSPLGAAAAGIAIDMAATAHNRALLENGAEPGGLIAFKEGFPDKDEEKEWKEKWEARHKGPGNHNRMGFAAGDVEYFEVGLSPKDMDYLEQRRWNRDEVLAVLGVPKAVLSITDDLNYATFLGQVKQFWDGLLFPVVRMIEDVLDGTLLFPETDNLMAVFDLSGIEALRIGLDEKTNAAKAMCGTELHMPPEMAFELVGLDVASYPGSDTAFVTFGVIPVEDAIGGLGPAPDVSPPPGAPDDGPDDGGDGGEGEPPSPPDDEEEPPTAQRILVPAALDRQKQSRLRIWRQIMRMLQEPMEATFGNVWKRWLRTERRLALEQFDAAARGELSAVLLLARVKQLDLSAVLLDVGETQQRLGGVLRPVFSGGLESVFEFTSGNDLGGIPVFGIDDPRLLRVFQARQQKLLGTAPETLQRNLRTSLSEGLQEGESLGQLRQRVAEVYNVAGSDAKTLQVARTEAAGFVNGTRNAMFEAQGFTSADWITAGDEAVRANHVAFGAVGAKPLTHNYLNDRVDPNTGGGSLEFPSDPNGPAAEVINCRCVHVPVAE